jgi:hypothetical protein
MENTQNLSLIEKIKSMTAKEHIMNMVEGLRNPMTVINMDTFGEKREDGVCFGCAATNSICRLIGSIDPLFPAWLPGTYSYKTNVAPILATYEDCIDMLRRGDVDGYNDSASYIGIATIKDIESIELPVLMNDYTEEELLQYVALSDAQE